MLPEAARDIIECGLLVRLQSVELLAIGKIFRFSLDQIRPVERPAGETAEPKHLALRFQALDRLICIRSPRIPGVYKKAPCEWFPCGSGNERIKMFLGNVRVGCITLALDGAVATVAFLGYQVDPDVHAIEIDPLRRPFRPKPDIAKTIPVERILDEVCFHQSLEKAALLGFGISNGPYVIQNGFKAIIHLLILFGRDRCMGRNIQTSVTTLQYLYQCFYCRLAWRRVQALQELLENTGAA